MSLKKDTRSAGHWLLFCNLIFFLLLRNIKKWLTTFVPTIRLFSPVWKYLLFCSRVIELTKTWFRSSLLFFSCLVFCASFYFYKQRLFIVYTFDYFSFCWLFIVYWMWHEWLADILLLLLLFNFWKFACIKFMFLDALGWCSLSVIYGYDILWWIVS